MPRTRPRPRQFVVVPTDSPSKSKQHGHSPVRSFEPSLELLYSVTPTSQIVAYNPTKGISHLQFASSTIAEVLSTQSNTLVVAIGVAVTPSEGPDTGTTRVDHVDKSTASLPSQSWAVYFGPNSQYNRCGPATSVSHRPDTTEDDPTLIATLDALRHGLNAAGAIVWHDLSISRIKIMTTSTFILDTLAGDKLPPLEDRNWRVEGPSIMSDDFSSRLGARLWDIYKYIHDMEGGIMGGWVNVELWHVGEDGVQGPRDLIFGQDARESQPGDVAGDTAGQDSHSEKTGAAIGPHLLIPRATSTAGQEEGQDDGANDAASWTSYATSYTASSAPSLDALCDAQPLRPLDTTETMTDEEENEFEDEDEEYDFDFDFDIGDSEDWATEADSWETVSKESLVGESFCSGY